MLSSTSLDLIEKMNHYSRSLLHLAFAYTRPRRSDRDQMREEPNQFITRISSLFSDSAAKIPCARSQFANLLRSSVKAIGLGAFMVTRTVEEIQSSSEDNLLGSMTVLALLLHTSYASNLKRVSQKLNQALAGLASNPLAASYCLITFSQLPKNSEFFIHVPALMEIVVANLRYGIMQESLSLTLPTMIRSHREITLKLMPQLLEECTKCTELKSLSTLVVLCNECIPTMSNSQFLGTELAVKALHKLISSIDLNELQYDSRFSYTYQSILDIFHSSFGWILKRDHKAIESLKQSDPDLTQVGMIDQVLLLLCPQVTEANVSLLDDLIFSLTRVSIVLAGSRLGVTRREDSSHPDSETGP